MIKIQRNDKLNHLNDSVALYEDGRIIICSIFYEEKFLLVLGEIFQREIYQAYFDNMFVVFEI